MSPRRSTLSNVTMAHQPRGSFLGAWTNGHTPVEAQSFFDEDNAYREPLHNESGMAYPLPGGFPSGRARRRKKLILAMIVLAIALTVLFSITLPGIIADLRLRIDNIPPGLWSKDGQLVIARSEPFKIKGFSWYGLEERTHPPHILGGLEKISADKVLKFATDYKFNALRIPLAYDLIVENPFSQEGSASFKNPSLSGKQYLQFVHNFIRKCAERHLLVLLDLHRIDSRKTLPTGYWYNAKVSENDVIKMWGFLCEKFERYWNVMGADIVNEPHKGVWDDSNKANNWKRASRRITNRIHRDCPHWLVLVQGMGDQAGGPNVTRTPSFWGENLSPLGNKPLEVKSPRKVALSPHVYGTSQSASEFLISQIAALREQSHILTRV